MSNQNQNPGQQNQNPGQKPGQQQGGGKSPASSSRIRAARARTPVSRAGRTASSDCILRKSKEVPPKGGAFLLHAAWRYGRSAPAN